MGGWLHFRRGEVGWERKKGRRRRNRGRECRQRGYVYNGFYRWTHRRKVPIGDSAGESATSLYDYLGLNPSVISHIGSERPEPGPYKCMLTLTSKTCLKPWGGPGWKPRNGWTRRPKRDSIWQGECAALLWKTRFGVMRGCQEQTREGDLGGSPGFGWTGRPKADNILLVRWGVTPLVIPSVKSSEKTPRHHTIASFQTNCIGCRRSGWYIPTKLFRQYIATGSPTELCCRYIPT